jgi:hypothetical protein
VCARLYTSITSCRRQYMLPNVLGCCCRQGSEPRLLLPLLPVQGTYVYFDYNIMHDDLQTGWCYRRKENFTFRWVGVNVSFLELCLCCNCVCAEALE